MDIELEINNLKKRIEVLEQLFNVNTNIIQNTTNTNRNLAVDSTSNRDKTKYIFNGKVLPKNRLVLNVIKEYVKQNNPTLSELQRTFDKTLQGSRIVVENLELVKNISDYKKRYFCNNDDIILLKDNTKACVCTQWGIFNIKKFLLVAKNLGFNIDEI